MTVTAWAHFTAGRLLLIVIVMMLLLMQIDAENNTEYRAACRNDTADQRNDSHRASPLPLSRGTTEVPPGFREQTAFSPGFLSDQNSLVPVYQSSTISASSKPPQGHLTLRRLLFSLYVRKLGGLVSDTPVGHFFGGAAADGAGVGQVLLGEGDAAGGHAGLFLHL